MKKKEIIAYYYKPLKQIDLTDVIQFCSDPRENRCECGRCYKYLITTTPDEIKIERY